MEITKPLRRVCKIRNSKEVVVLIDLKYERLPTFVVHVVLLSTSNATATSRLKMREKLRNNRGVVAGLAKKREVETT